MDVFISSLGLLWDFLLSTMGQIFNLYMVSPVLIGAFALWVLDRVFHIFDLIKG